MQSFGGAFSVNEEWIISQFCLPSAVFVDLWSRAFERNWRWCWDLQPTLSWLITLPTFIHVTQCITFIINHSYLFIKQTTCMQQYLYFTVCLHFGEVHNLTFWRVPCNTMSRQKLFTIYCNSSCWFFLPISVECVGFFNEQTGALVHIFCRYFMHALINASI